MTIRARSTSPDGNGDGGIIFIRPDDIGYIILAAKVASYIWYDNGRKLMPTDQSGVLMQTSSHKAVKAKRFVSVKTLTAAIDLPKQFITVNRGLAVNLKRVEGISDPRENVRLVHVRTNGKLEYLVMSEAGAARLNKALDD